MGFQVDAHTLERIWSAHGLGRITSTEWAGKGVNNPSLLVNDAHVIRFDGLINEGVSRFHGEVTAYNWVQQAGIPCPDVLLVDDSKRLAPYDYMIMNKVDGQTLLDSWPTLTPAQQTRVALEAGRLLGVMHTIRVPLFGPLYGEERRFTQWTPYVMDTMERKCHEALDDRLLTRGVYDRLRGVFEGYSSVLAQIDEAHLVHWDYHFGNILQRDGVITAVLDFEWALGGDPLHDFTRQMEWEEQCPGSRAWVYAGYRELHPLADDHDLRVTLYELLWFLDCMVDAPDAVEADVMRGRVMERLEWLASQG